MPIQLAIDEQAVWHASIDLALFDDPPITEVLAIAALHVYPVVHRAIRIEIRQLTRRMMKRVAKTVMNNNDTTNAILLYILVCETENVTPK